MFAAIVGDRLREHWTRYQDDLYGHVPGFAPFSIDTESRPTANISKTVYLKRTDRNFGLDDASNAAGDRLIAVLTPIVNQWATANKRIMLEAELGSTGAKITQQRSGYERALETLRAEEDKIADLVIHEAQVRNALRR